MVLNGTDSESLRCSPSCRTDVLKLFFAMRKKYGGVRYLEAEKETS